MPSIYMLDTNICIYIQRRKPSEVLSRFEKLKPGDAVISVITWGELLYGAEKSKQRKKALQLLEEFQTFVPVLFFQFLFQVAHGRHKCVSVFPCVGVVSVHVHEKLPGIMGDDPQDVK